MKYFISAALLVISASASAGISSDDPVVALIRDRFRNAHVPSKAEMKLKESWSCIRYSAMPGDYKSNANTRESITFDQFDGVYIRTDYGPTEAYVPTPQGIVNTGKVEDRSDLISYFVIKAESNGALIFEASVKRPGETHWIDIGKTKLLDRSIAINFGFAVTYFICEPTKGNENL